MKKIAAILVAAVITLTVLSAVGSAEAVPQSVAHSMPKPVTKTFRVLGPDGKVSGTWTVNVHNGKFVLRCFNHGLRPDHKYILQYHVKGLFGAGPIATVWAHRDHTGTTFVYAKGKVNHQTLELIKKPGELLLGTFVL
jgi:hypothetical protein